MGTSYIEVGMDAEMEVYAGGKGIHPIPPTPKTDRDSSVVIRLTGMDVGRSG